MTMKTWYIEYMHRTIGDGSQVRGYTVIAENDDMAVEVGKESLENDEKNYDPDPNNWSFKSCSQVELCRGCGGERRVSAAPGSGAIR